MFKYAEEKNKDIENTQADTHTSLRAENTD